jgi:hypothetical protein
MRAFLFQGKDGARVVGHPCPGDSRGINPSKHTSLVIFVQRTVKQLFEAGRDFLWPKPEGCPRCRGRIWGHGFVPAFFDGYEQPLWLKRYRCPDCGCVIRLRPRGYFKRFQTSIHTIRDCLAYWVRHHRWKTGPSPPRQRHWVRALRRHLVLREGLDRIQDLVAGFDRLWGLGIIPVSRSM